MVAEVVQLDPPVEKVGLGYQMRVPEIGVGFFLTRVRRRSDEIRGYLTVKARIAGVKTFGDYILMVGNLDIMGTRTRKDWATTLAARAPGVDIDWSWLLNYFAERIIAGEMEGEPILSIGSQPVPRTAGQWAINPLVPKGVASLLYAPGGSGKSQTALACALSIQLGREIIPGCPPAIKGNVLYLDWETQKEVLAERLQRICRGIGPDVAPPDIFYRRCIKPLADDAEELSSFVADKDIVFVVVDSCEPAMGRANEYGDANEKALRLFDALRLIGCSALVVDHVSKQEMSMTGRKRGKMPYGSVYKVNLARAAWEMKPVTTLSDETIIVGMHHTKANDSRLMDPIGLQIGFNNAEPQTTTFRAHDGALETYEDADEDGRSYTPVATVEAQVSELLEDHRLTPVDTAKYLGLNYNSVRSAMNRMHNAGTLVKHPDGRYGA